MKILIGTHEIAGQIHDYAEGFRELGHEVTTAIRVRNELFPDIKYDIDLSNSNNNLNYIRNLIEEHDLFIFQFGYSLLPENVDFQMIKRAGKKIISIFNGSDIRHFSAFEQQFGISLKDGGEKLAKMPLVLPLRNLRMAEMYSDLVVSVPNQSGLALRPYNHFYYPMNPALYKFNIPCRDKPVIVHAPSDKPTKGSKLIREAMESLKQEGLEFEFRLLHGVPNSKVIEQLTTADIAIDQIYLPYGKFAAEAMACGCAVATPVFTDIEAISSIRGAFDIRPHNIKEQLRKLIVDKELRLKIARQGKKYFDDFHDRKRIAKELLSFFNSNQQYDYYPSFFATKYRLPESVEIPAALKKLSTEIVRKFGIPCQADFDSMRANGLLSMENVDSKCHIKKWSSELSSFNKFNKIPLSASHIELLQKEDEIVNIDENSSLYYRAVEVIPSCGRDFSKLGIKSSVKELFEIGKEYADSGNGGDYGCFYLLEAEKINKNSIILLWSVANLMFGSGRFDEARQKYELIIKRFPDSGIAYFYLGTIFAIQNKIEKALENYGKAVMLLPKKQNELIWGPEPIINNMYWSAAMKESGYKSKTLMRTYYGRINDRNDFNLYFHDLLPSWVYHNISHLFKPYFAFLYLILNASAVIIPFSGSVLNGTILKGHEFRLLKSAGVKIVVSPYGSDFFRYSRVTDMSMLNALLLSYPEKAKHEEFIQWNMQNLIEYADVICGDFHLVHGLGRWDVLAFNRFHVDVNKWEQKVNYNMNNGKDGPVKVMHMPNHRGAKGTEFIIQAVEELKQEGLKVELVLIEGVKNKKVLEIIKEGDILAAQCVLIGHGINEVEGMASGLTVLANFENDQLKKLFTRYGFLGECPIVSTTPETIKQNLKILVQNPNLRKDLGLASRAYAEKYHSYKTSSYFWGSIFRKILDGEEVDLMNIFHPLKSAYNISMPIIKHDLINNRLPEKYLSEGK